MRAEASHAGTLRVPGLAGSITRELPILRTSPVYVDYGRPPRGRSMTSQVAVLAVAALFLQLLSCGVL